MRFHHVQLAIPPGGEERGRAFYGGVLGLTEVAKPEPLAKRGGCWFRSADGKVEIHLGIEDPFTPARKAHPALEVEDLEGLARAIEVAGHTVEWDDRLPGHRRCHVTDPFGNRLELLSPAG